MTDPRSKYLHYVVATTLDQGSGQVVCVSLALIRFPQIIMMTGGHLVYLADCIISVINS